MKLKDWKTKMNKLLYLLMIIAMLLTSCSLLQSKPSSAGISTKPTIQTVCKTDWLVTLSILGIAGGAFATLNGLKWGVSAIVACCVALFMSLATAAYAEYMAICGLIGSILLVAGSIIMKSNAIKELVSGFEANKDMLNSKLDMSRARMNEMMSKKQSKYTKHIVKRVKSKL